MVEGTKTATVAREATVVHTVFFLNQGLSFFSALSEGGR
jgi:hypothetical protein